MLSFCKKWNVSVWSWVRAQPISNYEDTFWHCFLPLIASNLLWHATVFIGREMVFRLGAEHPDAIISAQRPQRQTLWQRWRLSRDVRYQKRLDYHGVCQWAQKRWLLFSWTFIFVLEHPVEQPVHLNGQDSKPSWELHVKSTLSLVFTFSYKTFSFSLLLRLMLCRSSYLLQGGVTRGLSAGWGCCHYLGERPQLFAELYILAHTLATLEEVKAVKERDFPSEWELRGWWDKQRKGQLCTRRDLNRGFLLVPWRKRGKGRRLHS